MNADNLSVMTRIECYTVANVPNQDMAIRLSTGQGTPALKSTG